MREILFRGKQFYNGRWIHGGLVERDGRVFIVGVSSLLRIDGIEVDPETICQDTGLTDKNGKKIWENDVCRYIDSDEYETEFVVKYGRHEDHQGTNLGFYIEWLEMDWYRKDICFWVEERAVEVIGNIFDNPELMKGGSDHEE